MVEAYGGTFFHTYFCSYSPNSPASLLFFCFSVHCSIHSDFGLPLVSWPPWYNNATRCTGLIFVSSRAVRGFCLSFSMTALNTYLPFHFEAWLTGRQRWHSCRRRRACYYAYINILINTWSTIEEIITCHHSTVWKILLCCVCVYVYVCVQACTHTLICMFHLINIISVPLVLPYPLMASTSAPLIWKSLPELNAYHKSQNLHSSSMIFHFQNTFQLDLKF